MSQNVEQIVLDVKLNADNAAAQLAAFTAETAQLKKEQAELKKQMAGTGEEAENAAAQYAENAKRLQDVQRAAKTATAVLQQNQKDFEGAGDSVKVMRNKLDAMLKAYDNMSKEVRESDIGRQLKDQINSMTDELTRAEEGTGRYQRNVGSYAKALEQFGKSFPIAGKGVEAFGKAGQTANNSFKTLAANPIMAMVSLLVTIIIKLTDKFKQNGAATESLTKAFGVFNGIGTVVNKLLDSIAAVVVKLVDGFLNLADKLGIVNDEVKAGVALAQQELELNEKRREANVKESEAAIEVADLREKATDKEKYSVEERTKFLDEAAKKEQDIADERLRIAQQEYDLQVQKNAQSKSSQEDLNKEAELLVKVNQAKAAALDTQRQYNKQLNALRNEANSEAAAAEREAQQRAKAAREARKKAEEERARAQKEIHQQLQDAILEAEADEGMRSIEQRKLQGQREIDALKERLATEKNLSAQSRDELAQIITLKQDALDKDLAAMADEYAKKRAEADAQREREHADRLRELRLATTDEESVEYLEIRKEQLDAQMALELENAELTEQEKLLIREKYNQQKDQLDAEYQKKQDDALKASTEQYKQEVNNAIAQAYALYGQITEFADAFIGDERKRVKAQKAFGLANVAIAEGMNIANTAAAISKAVQNATEAAGATGPAAIFTQPTFVATLVASVLAGVAGTVSNITQAKKIISSSQAFAEGGIVAGNSFSGDNVITRTNSGEMVLTRQQQTTLFDIANGAPSGINYSQMADIMAAAFASAPAPVLTYKEFNDFSDSVVTYQELSKI